MSDSSHRFLVGFTKAVERRSKQTKQHVKPDSDVAIMMNATATQLDNDELYRVSIISKMTTLIHKRKTAQ